MHPSQQNQNGLPAGIGLLALCLLGGCLIHVDSSSNRVSHQRQVDLKRAANSAQTLKVYTPDGNITVHGEAVTEVTLSATIKAWASDRESARVAAEEIAITLELQEAVLEARVTFPTHWRNRSARIDMTLVVPQGLALDLDTGDGNIKVRAMHSAVDARTGDGNITAKTIEGDLVLNTGDGTLDMANIQGPRIHAHTSDGRITLRDARTADLNLHSNDGRIQADGITSEKMHVHTSDGAIGLHCSPDAPSVLQATLDTHDGSIEFSAPLALSVQVNAQTGDGHITVDFPITTQGKLDRSIQGTIGAGEGKLTLHTGDGSIHIRQSK